MTQRIGLFRFWIVCFILISACLLVKCAVVKKILTGNKDDNDKTSGTSGYSQSSGTTPLCSNTTGEYCNHRARLYTDLFGDYNKNIRPYCGNNDVINTTIDVAIRLLLDVNEPMQILKLNAWIRMTWFDCQLVWNASDYNDIESLGVSFTDVWVPDLTHYDSIVQEFPGYREFRPIVSSNGMVSYNFPTVIEAQCSLDVKYFPFDTQMCPIVFGSWAHNGFEVDFLSKGKFGDLSATQTNTEWDVVSFNTFRNVTYFNCCPEPYPDVRFILEIKRKPLFYVVLIMIPTFFIALLGVLVFALTVESGEKTGTAFTILLSMVVLLLIVSESLPASAETLPLIVLYFAFTLCLSGFGGIVAVVSINLYQTENTPMSPCVRTLFLGCIAKLVLIDVPKKKHKDEIVNNINHKELCKTSEPRLLHVNKLGNHESGLKPPEIVYNNSEEEEVNEWKLLSYVVDRFCGIIYVIVLIIGTLLLGLQYYFQA